VLGVKLADVKCAVVTHVHADHAGGARALQEKGIRIIAGAGDLARAQRGDHGELVPTSVFAQALKWFLPAQYAPFTPDVLVDEGGTRDLADCGVAGQVLSMPGHTRGSLVVLVDGGKVALVGDLFRGGALGGLIQRQSPKEHFYQDDLALDHRRIHELLARGVEVFVLGHGGPSRRSDVADEFGATD
jgi:glyoxylase-like metal-dependent hydrolase (beta-lactamase superfamily II)